MNGIFKNVKKIIYCLPNHIQHDKKFSFLLSGNGKAYFLKYLYMIIILTGENFDKPLTFLSLQKQKCFKDNMQNPYLSTFYINNNLKGVLNQCLMML